VLAQMPAGVDDRAKVAALSARRPAHSFVR
jgi:hypothetical protein